LLDASQGSQGDNNATNSVVTADLRVPAGKLIEATLRHRAATITLKLVNRGGRGARNTSFRADAGRDVIRELIGAFPSLMLRKANMWPSPPRWKNLSERFKVQSTKDADVEFSPRNAQSEARDDAPPIVSE